MNCDIDHLVIGAASLEQGVAWCAATLGIPPGPGGVHPFMGTHNRLLRIDGPGFANCYLEIIAIDPAAAPPGRPRWFGLDDPALQARLAQGPQLLTAVARTPDIAALRAGLIDVGQDPGPALAAQRPTPDGLLAWRILVRGDGALPGQGRLPVGIEWQGRHPTEAMPMSAVVLQSLRFGALQPRESTLLCLRGAQVAPGGPALAVTLQTPRGSVELATA